MRVDIYTKPDCSLCDEARAVLERLRARWPFTLAEVDLRTHPDLLARYRYDLPVVWVDGELAFRHRVDEAALEARLRQPAPAGTPVARTGFRSE